LKNILHFQKIKVTTLLLTLIFSSLSSLALAKKTEIKVLKQKSKEKTPIFGHGGSTFFNSLTKEITQLKK